MIAETAGLPTKFAKMVVTDDQGRYVLPELPKANYTVWVRGYGLVDSPKVNVYAKWMDGRIDDANAGWKGCGLWATTGTRTPFHMEGGLGTRPKVVEFQLRPDPLAH